MDSFDYVIAGAGTAAGIIAYRLGEAGKSVCVLESGPADRNLFLHVPAGTMMTQRDPALTWQLDSEPGAGLDGRRIHYMQGRTLGGSSAINGMVYNRGQAADFDHWAQRGNPGWGYEDVLPYFRRSERFVGEADDRYHGRDGRITVSRRTYRNPIGEAFLAAAEAYGYPRNDDYNGALQEGVGRYQAIIDGRWRVSTATGFLNPARRKFKVDVRTGALVTRVLLEGRRATGLEYVRDGKPQTVTARESVIISAGPVQSPKLLQLSGIGPEALLREHGIAVHHALPGVGENLHDHYNTRVTARARPGTGGLNMQARGLPLLGQIALWALGRPSILSLPVAMLHVFAKSDPALDEPDFYFTCSPGSLQRPGVLNDFPAISCGSAMMRPQSRGYVRIRSADPHDAPAIDPNYLTAEIDRIVSIRALKAARAVMQTHPMADLIETEVAPGLDVQKDEDWLPYLKANGVSSLHLCGACKMGPASDTLAVTDPRLKVHGLEGLRVADSSVIPAIPSANTMAATMMIAEKAADLFLEDARLGRR